LFNHPFLPQTVVPRPRQDCSAAALATISRHVREMQVVASLPFHSSGRSKKTEPGADCPATVQGLAAQLQGPFPERVGACVSQDGPLDPEWDALSSAVISLGVCLDCGRPRNDRAARCKQVADVVATVEKTARAPSPK
jgi:hypothetical protein